MPKPKLTGGEVATQMFSPVAPIEMIGGLFGVGRHAGPENTMVQFDQGASNGFTPERSFDPNDPEAMAQLEFYAAMNGMTVDEFILAMEDDPMRGMQAPQIQAAARQASSPQAQRAAALQQAMAEAETGMQGSIQRESDDVLGYWDNTVNPALAQQRSAVANQQTANRLAETELRGAGNTLNQQLAATQAQRMSGINSANAAQTQAMNALLSQNNASNQQATNAASGLNSQLSNISRNQSAANDMLGRQLGQINTEQSRANDVLGSQLSNANDMAWGATDEFGNQMHAANMDQDRVRQQLVQDLYDQSQQGIRYVEGLEDSTYGLNYEDQLATNRYLEQTNPLLAERFAQGSDPRLVQQVQDVHDRFKELSNPEVTAQERFIAELARRKTESNDKSSRDAVYEQMRQRGLNSGGQQIAAQLANRQATSQDRVLAELGLSASAQQRAFSALGQQGDVAAQLRGADDGMRQFQDTYAQNDAIRRQNVMQGQADTQMRSTAQRGDRNSTLYNAQRANLNDTSNRSGMAYDAESGSIAANAGRNAQVFDATTGTINNNANREVQRFDATSMTNRDNAGRNVNVFDATTATNTGNTNRAGMGFDATRGVINDNSGRNTESYNARTGTTEANFGRSEYGWNSADQNAGTGYDIARGNTDFSTSNRSNEVGSAQGLTGSSISAGTGYSGVRGGIGTAERDALERILGNRILAQTDPNERNNEDEN